MPSGVDGFQKGRLTMVRQGRAMLKRELAQAVGKSEATISKWESGLQRPDPSSLPILALALDVSANWFLMPLDDDHHAVFNRSLISELQVFRRRSKARLGFVETIESCISEYMDLPEIDIPVLGIEADFKDLRIHEIEAIADDLRSHWQLPSGPIQDLLLVMENAGIVIGEDNVGSIKLDGVSWWSGRTGKPYVLLAKDKKSSVRRRFDAAHELAHIVLHKNVKPDSLKENFALIEEQAMHFAGAFLMPRQEFQRSVFSVSLDGLLALKEEWGVSVGAMIKRLVSVGDLSLVNERKMWQYYSSRRWRAKEPLDDSIKIESPQILATSLSIMANDPEIGVDTILNEICLSRQDIVTLCGLPEDFFGTPIATLTRKTPSIKVTDSAQVNVAADKNIIPFRRR